MKPWQWLKYAGLLLPALLMALHADAANPTELVVATYNLRLNLESDGVNAWPQRREAVKALVRYHAFDLFGTQEALPDQINDLETMTEYVRVGVGRDDGKDAGEHAAIFFRRTRFALLAHGDFWFSETPDRPSRGWDARCCNRLATWARLRDHSSDKTLLVVSVHFDHEGVVARRESAQQLLRWIAKNGGNDAVIALGDFNSTPDTEQIVAMRAMLLDARVASQTPAYGPLATFNNFKFGATPELLIDYIFVSPGVRVLKYAVLTDSTGRQYPSDHFPVVATIKLD